MGDYTRSTFKPRKGYAAVKQQQGRVSLDADHNEAADIIDRRLRTTTMDTIGRCAVPEKTTPDAFKIESASGGFTIGGGRAYVDGIQIECWGRNGQTPNFHRSLGEDRGKDPLPFADQPFYYRPGFPAPVAEDNSDQVLQGIVYVHVWRREVTVVEDPELREPALGGPDTTTRLQTAWQVKFLAGGFGSDGDNGHEAWTKLTNWQPGRLSTATPGAAPEPSPCVINPVDGYTGLENRLYRVEIHTGGQCGSNELPQFKWSRDNASLTVPIEAISDVGNSQSDIKLAHTGRDQWQRFEVGQHVEILDDHVEWAAFDTGQGGTVVRIVAVDVANATVRVDQDLSAFEVAPARHPRVRRWDTALEQAVLRSIEPGNPIPLEDGIAVTFKCDPEAVYRAGDYWIFHARTASGGIEELVDAPPHGPSHHFCKLAVVTTGAIKDCRQMWPPRVEPSRTVHGEGCCTVVVAPGEDMIQQAIHTVAERGGGCVCLKAGEHKITEPITISAPGVLLHGESIAARVVRCEYGPLLIVGRGALDVEVHTVTFDSRGKEQNDEKIEGVIRIEGGSRAKVHDCAVTVANPSAAGFDLSNASEVRIERNRTAGSFAGVIGSSHGDDWALGDVIIADNDIVGRQDGEIYGGVLGIDLTKVSGACSVTNNRLEGFATGVRVALAPGITEGPLIADNRIDCATATGSDPDPAHGVSVKGDRAIVQGNQITLAHNTVAGVSVQGSQARIHANSIRVVGGEGQGIYIGVEQLNEGGTPTDGVVSANSISDVAVGIRLVSTHRMDLCENTISVRHHGDLSAGVIIDGGSTARVMANRIKGARQGQDGVLVRHASDLTISDNDIEDMTGYGIGGEIVWGNVVASRNRLVRCALSGGESIALGLPIEVQVDLDLTVEHNEVIDTGISGNGELPNEGVGIHLVGSRITVHGNRVGFTRSSNEMTSRTIGALLVDVLQRTQRNGDCTDDWVLVCDNSFTGFGAAAVVEIKGGNGRGTEPVPCRVSFSNNYCVRYNDSNENQQAAVSLRGHQLIVQGNHVKAAGGKSFNLHGCSAVLLGNIATHAPTGLNGVLPNSQTGYENFNQMP